MAYKRYRKLSTVKKKLAGDAIDFCVDKFLKRMSDTLTITIKGDELLMENESIYGDCDYQEDHDTKNPKEFTIRVDTECNLTKFLHTIMHEMVHVKQYAKGELRYLQDRGNVKPMTFRWKQRRINSKHRNYYDLPWEIEAHGRELGLVIQFLDAYPDWNEFIEVVI